MKAAQNKVGKKLFSNESTGREVLRKMRDAGRENSNASIRISPTRESHQTTSNTSHQNTNRGFILREG